jgi:hypothetical protein
MTGDDKDEMYEPQHYDAQEDVHRRLAPPPYDGYDKECPDPYKVRWFRTPPAPTVGVIPSSLPSNNNQPPPPPPQEVRFAIVGDLGQFPHSQETLQRLYRSPEDIDLVLLAGDIAYAGTDGKQWDTFFDFWDDTPLAEQIPVCNGTIVS